MSPASPDAYWGREGLLGTILDTLARLDTLTPMPQPTEGVTLAPRLKKQDGALDWTRPARELVNCLIGLGGEALVQLGRERFDIQQHEIN